MKENSSKDGSNNKQTCQILNNDELLHLARSSINIIRQYTPDLRFENVDQMITLLTKIAPNAKESREVAGVDLNSIFFLIREEREKQLIDLIQWESNINLGSSGTARIKIFNLEDLDGPPLDFSFVNKYIMGQGVFISQAPPIGCECRPGGCLTDNCCCSIEGGMPAYTKDRRLKVPRGTPIYECNESCLCPPNCENRVVQNGRTFPVAIFKTGNGRGWGLKTLGKINEGEFVTEYIGEVITTDEAESRGRRYKDRNYFFDLDFNGSQNCLYTIDATKHGNESRFINHSCNPNLVVFAVWVNCLDPNFPRLCFFASRDIEKNEELTLDYSNQSVHDKKKKKTYIIKWCKCGARNCRRYIF